MNCQNDFYKKVNVLEGRKEEKKLIKELVIVLKNIAGITKEELDKISKKIALTKYDSVELSPDDWVEQDGIRYLKTPIKVHFIPWSHYTLDCAFLMSKVYDPEFQYVYAFSTTEESTALLKKLYFDESLKKIGYYYYLGLQREELSAID
mgnify:FL=1